MRRVLYLSFTLLLMGTSSASFAASAGASLQSFLDATTLLGATFEQRLFDEQRRLQEESSGTLVLRRPGQFRWHYIEPFEQEIVADGELIWIYDADLKQVAVRPMGRTMGGSPAVLLSASEPLVEIFDLTDAGERGGFNWVELKPREQDVAFVLLRIGMRDGLIGAMDLVDTFGQTTELRFFDLNTSPSVTAETFTFKPPAGTDVIDERTAVKN